MTLTPARLRFAARLLAERDTALKRVLDEHGYPQLWDRRPGFSTTVHIILEQQVSLASANATFYRLQTKLGGTVTPEGLLKLTEGELQEVGFTRQKIAYSRLLAEQVASGDLRRNARARERRGQGAPDALGGPGDEGKCPRPGAVVVHRRRRADGRHAARHDDRGRRGDRRA